MKIYCFSRFQWYFIQFICWAVLVNSFVIFEETVIDRSNWWKSMPGYRVGDPCIWDLGASVVFAILVLIIFRKTKSASPETD
jgi:hypothetical protein